MESVNEDLPEGPTPEAMDKLLFQVESLRRQNEALSEELRATGRPVERTPSTEFGDERSPRVLYDNFEVEWELSAARTECEKLRAELQSLRGEKKKVETALLFATSGDEELRDALKAAEDELMVARAEVEALKKYDPKAAAESVDQMKDYTALQTEVVALREKVESLEHDNGELKKDVETAQGVVEEMWASMEAVRAQRDQAVAGMKEARAEQQHESELRVEQGALALEALQARRKKGKGPAGTDPSSPAGIEVQVDMQQAWTRAADADGAESGSDAGGSPGVAAAGAEDAGARSPTSPASPAKDQDEPETTGEAAGHAEGGTGDSTENSVEASGLKAAVGGMLVRGESADWRAEKAEILHEVEAVVDRQQDMQDKLEAAKLEVEILQKILKSEREQKERLLAETQGVAQDEATEAPAVFVSWLTSTVTSTVANVATTWFAPVQAQGSTAPDEELSPNKVVRSSSV